MQLKCYLKSGSHCFSTTPNLERDHHWNSPVPLPFASKRQVTQSTAFFQCWHNDSLWDPVQLPPSERGKDLDFWTNPIKYIRWGTPQKQHGSLKKQLFLVLSPKGRNIQVQLYVFGDQIRRPSKRNATKSCVNSEHGLHLTSDPWIFLWHYPDLMVRSLDILPTPTAQLAIDLPWTYLLVVFCLIIPVQISPSIIKSIIRGVWCFTTLTFWGKVTTSCYSEISSGLMYLLRIERTSITPNPKPCLRRFGLRKVFQLSAIDLRG